MHPLIDAFFRIINIFKGGAGLPPPPRAQGEKRNLEKYWTENLIETERAKNQELAKDPSAAELYPILYIWFGSWKRVRIIKIIIYLNI